MMISVLKIVVVEFQITLNLLNDLWWFESVFVLGYWEVSKYNTKLG